MTPAADIRTLQLFFADTQARENSISQDDVQFLRVLKGIHENEGGQLEMPLPFKVCPLLVNKKFAVVQPKRLKRKLDRNPQVFDCSAKFEGTALNDHLLTGPDLPNMLTGVLCCFRKHSIAGMCDIEKMKLHLHKGISDSREVLESISVCNRTVEVKNIDFHHDYLLAQNVLMKAEYIAQSGSSTFKVELNEKPSTLLGILSIVASVYNLLGFLSPFVTSGKRVRQEMCLKGMGWYESVPMELRPRWESLFNDLSNLGKIQIPRCFTSLNFGKCQITELNHFSNGSSQGYG